MTTIDPRPSQRPPMMFKNVRVVQGGGWAAEPTGDPQPQRSKAQERRDAILYDAEQELRQARDLIVLALEGLALLVTPQHPNLPTLIGQQIEQVIEFRRVKR